MKTLKYILIALLLLTVQTPSLYADHSHGYAKAQDAYLSGDYQTAIHLWKEEAEKGELSAYEMLGSVYSSGKGVNQDYEEAAKWYQLAAYKGSTNAQYNIGKMYYEGLGLVRSLPDAYAWMLLSAAKGNVGAKKMLDIVFKQMTSSNIEKSQKVVFEIMQQLSKQ